MARLDDLELLRMIADGENATVEFKVSPPRPGELAERLCGMANAQGGLIIIGVEDASLKIVGVKDARLAIDVLLRATRIIQPVLFLDPLEPEIYVLDGKRVVVACIPLNNGPLYQAGGVCWVRRGTHTIPLSVLEMFELAHDRGLIKWELQRVPTATIKDLDLDKVRRYLELRSKRSTNNGRFDNLEEVLIGMKCAVVASNGDVVPTNAGILFFGYNPQQYLPQSEVVCVLYRDELGVGKYLDRKIVRGTLQELIDETEIFLNKYIVVGGRIEGWKRIDTPEYPIEALREAIVNAVVHRDYGREGESIRVFYYVDRVEIHSPGLLLPGITIEQMSRGEVMSKLRNPILANMLRDVPGYMERLGSGIKLMLNETRRMGLSEPQFREMSEFVVTFRNAPVSAAQSNVPISDGAEQLVLGSAALPEQMDRVTVIMRYVQEHGSISNREYRDLTGASQRTAFRDLEALVLRGVLKRVGKTRGRLYKLP